MNLAPLTSPLELSLIVPVLNEAVLLPGFLANLDRQRSIRFELILCDGGSTDGTLELAGRLGSTSTFPLVLVKSPPGRARQLNAGVPCARSDTLLFLHVDTELPDPQALALGLAAVQAAAAAAGHARVAGHYALRFGPRNRRSGPGYYFYECKARLGRPGTTHGDQGLLLSRSFFTELGGFDEALPLLEDTRFAEAAREAGELLLLPAEIIASSRRFESEGLLPRQVLNALVMNFAAIGWDDFFRAAPEVYRRQDRTRPLELLPFLRLVRMLLQPLPRRARFRLWYGTGVYVRSQGWQLGFALDCRRNFRNGWASGAGPTPCLNRFDRWFDRLTDHPPGRLATALLVRAWFALTLLRLHCRALLKMDR
jgi:rSAM/selenodomain-associated transferase 2